MKKVLIVTLILTMVFGTIAASAQGFVPPGQAKKGMTAAEWMEFRNKEIPPGLQKKGGLPPGLMGRSVLPPGIQMRFLDKWQWRDEWNEDRNEENIGWAETEKDLVDLLLDEDIDLIIFTSNIALTKTLNIDVEREIWIDGRNRRLTLAVDDDDFDHNMEWMIRVFEDTNLTMRRVILDGMVEEDDDDEEILEGLVWVEKDAQLTAYGNDLYNAEIGFGLDVEVYEDDDEEFLLEDNDYFNVEEPVVFYDGNVELYPE